MGIAVVKQQNYKQLKIIVCVCVCVCASKKMVGVGRGKPDREGSCVSLS